MQKHVESHMDHGFTQAQWDYIFTKYADKTAFFLDTFELPEDLGMVTNELYGPSVGDSPVLEADAFYDKRGNRAWKSRLVALPKRPTRFVRVIAGPHEEKCVQCGGNGTVLPDGGPFVSYVLEQHPCPTCDGTRVIKHACILYTAYGVAAPDVAASPREPGDIRAEMQTLEEIRRVYFEAFQRGKATDAMKAAETDAHAKIIALRTKRTESDVFWAQHALAGAS